MANLPPLSVLGKAVLGRVLPGLGVSSPISPASLAQTLAPFLARLLAPQPGTGVGVSSSGTNTTLSLTPTAVTPGSYTSTNLTVDATGRITAAANGSGGGGGITQLTGDVTAGPGSGSQAATLATVNSNVGTFQGLTVNGKGLVTAAANQGYLTGNQTVTLSGDISGSGATAITTTLATVNSNVGTFQGLTVNGKGLVTAAVAMSGDATMSAGVLTLATVTVAKGGTGITAGTSGGIPYYSSTSTIASSALLPTNGLIKGGGAGGAPLGTAQWAIATGTLTGNRNAAGFVNAITGDILELQQIDSVSCVHTMNAFAASNFIVGQAAAGTGATPTALTTSQIPLQLQARGFDGTAWSTSAGAIQIASITSPWTTGDHSTAIQFFTTPVGSTTLDTTADLDVRSAGVRIKGTNTNDSAAAGFVGEYLSTIKLIANTVSLTTATPANITSLALTVGDWDVWGELWLDAASTTTCSFATGAISGSSANIPSIPADGTAVATTSFEASTTISTTGRVLLVGPCRVSLSAGATMFLNVEAVFGVSTLSCYGKICARRVR